MARPWLKRLSNRLLSSDRVYIVPSPLGGALLLGLIAAFLVGTYESNPLLQLLSFITLIFFLVGMIQSNQNLAHLKIEGLQANPCPAQSWTRISVFLRNRGKEPIHSMDGTLSESISKSFHISILEKSTNTEAKIEVLTPERGVYPCPTLQITSRFPLGLFHVWRGLRDKQSWIIYPTPKGESLSLNQSGQGDEDFQGHRKILPGEPLSKIDWKAHARGSKNLAKEFAGEPPEALHFDWEQIENKTGEERLSQLSLWVQEAAEHDRAFSLTTPFRSLEVGAGRNHLHQAFQILAEYPR